MTDHAERVRDLAANKAYPFQPKPLDMVVDRDHRAGKLLRPKESDILLTEQGVNMQWLERDTNQQTKRVHIDEWARRSHDELYAAGARDIKLVVDVAWDGDRVVSNSFRIEYRQPGVRGVGSRRPRREVYPLLNPHTRVPKQ